MLPLLICSICYLACRSMTIWSSISPARRWYSMTTSAASSPIESLPTAIHQNIQPIQLSNDKLEAIRQSVESGLVYNTLYHLTLRGWPNHLEQVPRIAITYGAPGMSCPSRPVFSWREAKSASPPNSLTGHFMQSQAREAVYWPGINADIINYIKGCPICTKQAASLAQPMLPWDIPDSLWQELTADYFNHKDKYCLLICDLFNKDPFLYKVTSKSALCPSQKLQELITQYRPPAEST